MKRKSPVKSAAQVCLAVVFIFILQGIVLAGVAVSPLMQTIEVKPGKKAVFSINIANNRRGQETIACPVKIDVLDFTVMDRGQLSFGPEYKHDRSAAGWITTDANHIVLEPGESKELKFTVTAPIDADGDYWAACMITMGESQKDEKGVKVKLRTASGIFVRVARRSYSERGTITDINTYTPVFSAKSIPQGLSDSEMYALKEKQSLKIESKLKNEGLIEILARGKALIYNDSLKRVASVPLYSSRRQVLPGDSRWFTGIMSEPLPAGNYKLRIVYTSDSKYKRKITKDSDFTISPELAAEWAKTYKSKDNKSTLTFEPQKVELKLNPGRLTSTNIQVNNQSMNTIYANCTVEDSPNNWLEVKSGDFVLAPNVRSSISCVVKVPQDAKSGTYNWTVLVEMEKSGLENENSSETVKFKVPVSVVVDENAKSLSKK